MALIIISGIATDGDNDPYKLSIDNSKSTWTVTEPNGASKIFKTKSGKYVYKNIPDKGTYFQKGDGSVVFFLRNLVPDTAKKPDSGQGNVNETGRNVTWKVD